MRMHGGVNSPLALAAMIALIRNTLLCRLTMVSGLPSSNVTLTIRFFLFVYSFIFKDQNHRVHCPT